MLYRKGAIVASTVVLVLSALVAAGTLRVNPTATVVAVAVSVLSLWVLMTATRALNTGYLENVVTTKEARREELVTLFNAARRSIKIVGMRCFFDQDVFSAYQAAREKTQPMTEIIIADPDKEWLNTRLAELEPVLAQQFKRWVRDNTIVLRQVMGPRPIRPHFIVVDDTHTFSEDRHPRHPVALPPAHVVYFDERAGRLAERFNRIREQSTQLLSQSSGGRWINWGASSSNGSAVLPGLILFRTLSIS